MSRVLVLLGVMAGSSIHVSPAAAALNPELDKPYHYQIVLRVAPHPQLTDVFKERLGRALQDSVRGALGDAGEVTLVQKHPLLKEIDAKGLQQALDTWRGDKDRKTQFVLVDLVDETYRLQTGQFDGTTGMACPVVRRAETDDREFVARKIMHLIERDFGLVGTILDDRINPDRVRVGIKGSKLGLQLHRWVKKGDVFAVAEVRATGAGERSERLPGALLQVTEDPQPTQDGQEGVLLCRLHQRYQLRTGVLGYRCMKLGTMQAPLRLRFVNEATLAPPDTLQVWLSPFGLGQQDTVILRSSTDSDGFVEDKRVYDHVAFVKVLKNNELLANFPVEILEDRVIVCKVPAESKAGPLGRLEERKRRLLGHLVETIAVQANLNQELNEIIRKSQDQARGRAKTALTTLGNEIDHYDEERIELSKAARDLVNAKNLDLSVVEQRIQELKSQRDRLERFAKDLDTSIQAEPKLQELLGKLTRASILVEQADIDGALALYKEAEDSPKDLLSETQRSEIAARRQRLEKEWQFKGGEHKAARAFIYKTWAALEETRDIKKNLKQAIEAFGICRAAGDRWTVLKLKLTNDAIGLRLKERLDSLRPENEDDKIENQMIEEIAGGLTKLQKDVLEFLQKSRPAEK